MTLPIKYRPPTLEQVIGNAATVKAIDAMFTKRLPEDLPHAFLITGPSGCGKTTIARILKEMLSCSDRDFKELDAVDFGGIDVIRELCRNMRMKAMVGSSRVIFLDECHELTPKAQEGLLKALEDTPAHVTIILATTNPEKLKITLKRRCTHFVLSEVTEAAIIKMMKRIAKKEKVKIPSDVLEKIAGDSSGSPGIALGILDTVKDLEPEDMSEVAEQSAKELNEAIELCKALMKKKSWKTVSALLKTLEQPPESIRRLVLGYLSSVLLNSGKGDVLEIMECFEDNFYDTGKPGLVMACFRASS